MTDPANGEQAVKEDEGRPVVLTFDVCVHSGKLAFDGGVAVPTELIADLSDEAKKHKVKQVAGETMRDKLEQSHLFFLTLRKIWAAVQRDHGTDNWCLEESYQASGGSKPPWQIGGGAVVRIGDRDLAETKWVLGFDNDGNDKDRVCQAVTVEFYVGLRFR
ncbi:MAG: hypothetical protein KDE27_06135 [Planctomycetes bacterium]|nr:hypothetical protein [Planctomycetota bacterium]